jgi:hypothetical protein
VKFNGFPNSHSTNTSIKKYKEPVKKVKVKQSHNTPMEVQGQR